MDQFWLTRAVDSPLSVPALACVGAPGIAAAEIVTQHCLPLGRGARVLILAADEGVGLFTLQLCRRADAGLHLVAQVPAPRPAPRAVPSSTSSSASGSGTGTARTPQQAMECSKANGAHEVIVGDADWALTSILYAGSVDLLVDASGTAAAAASASATSRVMAPGGTVLVFDPLEQSGPRGYFGKHSGMFTMGTGWKLGRRLKSTGHSRQAPVASGTSSSQPDWLSVGGIATLSQHPNQVQDALAALAHAVADGSIRPHFAHVSLPRANAHLIPGMMARTSPDPVLSPLSASDAADTVAITLTD